jgi:hypothetical protein
MKYMLDLFAGLGGASEAMIHDRGWDVRRVDNNPLLMMVENMVNVDVSKLLTWEWDEEGDEVLDLLWASPPCREFSQAYGAPGPIANRAGIEFTPDLELVEIALELIELYKPKFWVIENVIGSIKHFAKLGLKPRQIIGPFVLYGNFPLIHIQPGYKHKKSQNDTWSTDPLRANRKALVPIEISRGLKEAIQDQKSIFNY